MAWLSSPTTTSIVISASSFGSVVTTGYVNLLTTRANYYITLTIRDKDGVLVGGTTLISSGNIGKIVNVFVTNPEPNVVKFQVVHSD